MSKVTSKLQVTLPKAIARQYGIEPGDEIEFQPAGEQIRLVTKSQQLHPELTNEQRLELFDQATLRQRARQASQAHESSPPERGWRREELYQRGSSG